MNRILLLLCAVAFFLSGASALTWEILWQRRMFLIFGASAPATTAILTAIFLGIAFGSQLAVPLLRRASDPFLLYAALEVVMGLWGLLVPSILSVSDLVYVGTVGALGEGHAVQPLLRFVLAIAPLLPATLAMGATIPVMVRCVRGAIAADVAWAYGVNILGAVGGCLVTGFVWLRWVGMLDTRLLAASLNAAATVIILLLRRSVSLTPGATDADRAPAISGGSDPPRLRRMGTLYFFSGFVALGLEVVWLRFLGIVNSNSTATFTLTLSVYLLGMGLGSLVVYPVLKRRMGALSIFSLANGGTALAALATFGILYQAAPINCRFIVGPAQEGTLTLEDIVWTEAGLTAGLMFLPTLCMGLVYPSVCDSCGGSVMHRDRWVGRSYFLGTLGSVLGILLIAMVIIPALGLHGAFCLLVCISAGLCVLAFGVVPRERRGWAAVGAGLGIVAWGAVLAHDPRPVLRETIAVQRAGRWQEVAVADGRTGRPLSDLVYVKSGPTATVMVKRTPGGGDSFVYVDDQLVASTNLEAKVDALMLAHLPLLLHADPASELTVGFGTGGTSHAITTHGIDAYCVEIEPEVPRAARYTQGQNFGVLDDPRFTLILNDARDHLHAGTRTYDVIATDVTNLQYKQNGNLYTVEYFELMQSRLNPGGIACAWIPMAGITPRELRILMRGFQVVFPHATLWYMNHANTNFGILIGTPGRLQVNWGRLEAGFADPEVSRSLASIGMVDPLQFVHCLQLDEDGYREFCDDAPLHTDDLPILEFSSPLSYYQPFDTFRQNLGQTLRLRPTDFRPYVRGVPEGLDGEFRRHQIASSSFCNVVLLMYSYIINDTRGHREEASANLAEALRFAEAGMAAWPEDRVREEFYVNFFSAAGGTLQTSP